MFVFVGVVGRALAVLCYAAFRDRTECRLNEGDAGALTLGRTTLRGFADQRCRLGRLFSVRASWDLVLGFLGNVHIGWMLIAGLPDFLEMHTSISRIGLAASVPYFSGVLGSILGSLNASRLLKGGMSAYIAASSPNWRPDAPSNPLAGMRIRHARPRQFPPACGGANVCK